jgi:hypothetical protein
MNEFWAANDSFLTGYSREHVPPVAEMKEQSLGPTVDF